MRTFGRKGLNNGPVPTIAAATSVPQATTILALDVPHDDLAEVRASGASFRQTLQRELSSDGETLSPALMIGLLAASGGLACVDTAMRRYPRLKRATGDPNLLVQRIVDGQSFYVGDLPHHYLVGGRHAILRLAVEAAGECGATLPAQLVLGAIQRVRESIGTPAFGAPRLPEGECPPASPLALAKLAWPHAINAFETINVAPIHWPAAIGFALADAIRSNARSLGADLAAQFAIEYAVPMAMSDPRQFADLADGESF